MDIAELHRLFRLDAETGRLYWQAGHGNARIRPGGEAGNPDKKGYRELSIGGGFNLNTPNAADQLLRRMAQ